MSGGGKLMRVNTPLSVEGSKPDGELVPIGRQHQQPGIQDPGHRAGDFLSGMDPAHGGAGYGPCSRDAAFVYGCGFDTEPGSNCIAEG